MVIIRSSLTRSNMRFISRINASWLLVSVDGDDKKGYRLENSGQKLFSFSEADVRVQYSASRCFNFDD